MIYKHKSFTKSSVILQKKSFEYLWATDKECKFNNPTTKRIDAVVTNYQLVGPQILVEWSEE